MTNLLDYLDDLLAADDLRPETLRVYASTVKNHIRPGLGDVELEDLDAARLRAFFADLRRREVGAGAIQACRKLLNKAFRAAMADGIMERNPMAAIKMPRRHKRSLDPPSREDVELVARTIGPHYRALVYVLAWTGLRIGEAGGLTVNDVDLERRRILVRQQSTRSGMADLKTEAARRVVAIPRFVAEELAHHIEKYPPRDGRIFSTRRGGVVRSDLFYPAFTDACERAGLRRFHPHELRHHAVSAMARSGAPIKAVQAAVGHTSAKLTLEVYSHVTEQDLQAIADRLDAANGPETGEPEAATG